MAAPVSSRSGKNTDKKDPRLELADRLIEQMEAGTASWQRPWEAGEVRVPVNAVTGNPYTGVNYQNLMAFSPDPSDPRWCTYKQAQEQGWQVRKGSRGLPIEVWKSYEHKRTPEEIEKLKAQGAQDVSPTEQRMGVRYYTVFHASQIDGIPPLERRDRNHELEGRPDPRLDGLAQNLGVSVGRGGGRAFYRPSEDHIQMPVLEDFHTAAGHDTTFLHEMAHATGHESRMRRDIKNAFGSEKYAIEELRAEMSAAMTAVSLGIGFDPESQNVEEGREVGNSAAYLASWLKALPEKERKDIMVQTIKDAQNISNYLIERTPELQVEAPEKAREAEKVDRPQEGDLVRFEPHDPNALRGMPFSGRVIAALDTSGGDTRYHLRAETGPDYGMEARVYGNDGSFRLIGIEQACGFDRNRVEPKGPRVQMVESPDAQNRENAYEQKIEARKERYRVLSEKMRARALERIERARAMADVIPFGQPILIGHHSEGRDRRYRARIHDNFQKGFALMDKAEYYERRARGVNDYAISADDPDAIQKLKERVETLKARHELMKKANAMLRKHEKDGPEAQREALEKLGFQADEIRDLLVPDVVNGGVGFASFALSNNKANIRRLEDRIESLEKSEKTRKNGELSFSWGTVRQNKDNNRIQFFFGSKPDESVRNLMKSSGFRWAPSEGAWQRQWTGNAIYSAKMAIKKLNEMMPPEQAVATPEQVIESPSVVPEGPRAQMVESPVLERAEDGKELSAGQAVSTADPQPSQDGRLVSSVKARDGTWYNLSVQEKGGQLIGALQRRGPEGGLAESASPFQSLPSDTRKLAAKFQMASGEVIAARLSPGENGSVQVDLFARSAERWEKIHERPGRLRANEALQKIPDHREGRLIEQALGVDPRALNPLPAREAHQSLARSPNKQKQQGVSI